MGKAEAGDSHSGREADALPLPTPNDVARPLLFAGFLLVLALPFSPAVPGGASFGPMLLLALLVLAPIRWWRCHWRWEREHPEDFPQVMETEGPRTREVVVSWLFLAVLGFFFYAVLAFPRVPIGVH